MRLAIAFVIASTGCLTSAAEHDLADPTRPGPVPPSPVARGPYQVASSVDITVELLLPEPAANLVSTLRDFQGAPARTLFDLAEDAGVPAVGTIRDALPAVLESKLEGWIDAEIAKMTLDGVPVTQLAGNLVAYAETALTQVRIDSRLAIEGTTATHTLAALDLAPAGLDARFELGGFPREIVGATTTVSSSEGTLALGAHGYSIAYGAYAWKALEAKFTADHGAGIRATLGKAVDCPRIAARVASTCVWGACVGHAAELTSICERGLDEVDERAHAKLATFRFDALRFEGGTATIRADGDALTDGVWTAKINAGQGLRHAPATFSAAR